MHEAEGAVFLVPQQLSALPSFGFLFDIDGVLVRGKTPIPAARTAFQKLVNSQGQFLVPVVFVTNAGNCLRQKKADQLSHLLGVPPITIETLREKHPLLDAVDHDRRPNVLQFHDCFGILVLTAVVLFGEPVRWETSLQLIIDVLLTSGYPGNPYHHENYPHIPVLACNMDLMWVAEAQSPRFGHGTFMVCLENIYKKITGRELKYEALMGKPSRLTYLYAEQLLRAQALHRPWHQPIHTLYAVGDNLMTDVYGANLYNRYLEENSRKGSKSRLQAQVSGGRGSAALPQDEDMEQGWENQLAPAAAAHCRSVLVCTGVYSPHSQEPLEARDSLREAVFHGHRDFRFDPGLVEPDHIVPDVDAAVDLVFQLENFAPN
ncbi:cat eye syndrome critical region protein 5-like protein [Pitangus sulphuratus]|nr:cat eye syndrome critical region protein 5-like protein [Pitangus sulphuratus]